MNFFIYLIFLTFLLLSSVFSLDQQAILQLDTRGHTGIIRDLIITKENSIITASVDKTIRIWDVYSGQELRKILGQIGTGDEGKIFAIALSPDEHYLAVGGFIGDNYAGQIRIYDYETGKLLQILKSHTNVVFDLDFSPDGRYLISGSADQSVKIWNMYNFTLNQTIIYHRNQVYGVKMFQDSMGIYYSLSIGFDKRVALHKLDILSRKAELLYSYKTDDKLKYIAINKNDIAVCGRNKKNILIFDYKLNLKRKIICQTKPAGLEFSPTGRYLIAGSGTYPCNVTVYDSYQNYKPIAIFKKHTNLTMAVGFLDDRTAVSAGGDNNEIYIWDIFTQKVKLQLKGVGQRIWSVGIYGKKIGFGNVWTANLGKSELQKYFDLSTFQVGILTPLEASHFNRIPTKQSNYSLSHGAGGEFGYDGAVLFVKKSGKTVHEIVRDHSNGYQHRCYGFYKNYIISGGANGHLIVYDIEGNEVARLIGHTGDIWSLAVQNDWLISGGDDQIIRIWNLKKLDLKKELYPMLNIFISKDDEWVVWSKSGYYVASVNGDQYFGYHINYGPEKEARFVSSVQFYKEKYRPDIIENIILYGDEKTAINIAEQKRKVNKQTVIAMLPPKIILISPRFFTTQKDQVKISFEVESENMPITDVIITLNGRKITQRGFIVKKKTFHQRYDIPISLEKGRNIIGIMAKNRYANSDKIYIEVERETPEMASIFKPNLFLLTIGISHYLNKDYNLRYADKDASDVGNLFKKQEGKLYRNVYVRELINEQATKDNILDALDWIDRESTQRDITVIFLAGHGVNDDHGNYYFLNYDADLDRLRRTGVKWYEFKDVVINLPSKVLLILDTCHSGNIMGVRRDLVGAIKSILDAGTGQIIMTATTGNGYSYENERWQHGAFSKAIIDGLSQNKADFNNDGMITIKELDLFITEYVKQLTKGKQKPTTIIPSSIPDFAIWSN